MSQSITAADPTDAILSAFLLEYEAATDPEATLRLWCDRRPDLAARFRARAATMRLLQSARPDDPDPIPARLGEFEIDGLIAKGGMGEIYHARHARLNRTVAIKVIRQGRVSSQARERFMREQAVLARLHQTHIVPIHTAGEEGPLQYFVMPFIDGASLNHVVAAVRDRETTHPGEKTPPLIALVGQAARLPAAANGRADIPVRPSGGGLESPPSNLQDSPAQAADKNSHPTPRLSTEYFRSVAQVMADAADGLQHSHDAGILHRDLKPSNFMIDRQGHCWVIDFGLAGLLQSALPSPPWGEGPGVRGDAAANDPTANSAQAASATAGTPLTTVGVMGTPPYMAPEQWDPDQSHVDGRTDVYGLGVTMYELLTLQRAIDGTDNETIRGNVLMGNAPAPRAMSKAIPRDLDAICRKAMWFESDRRYRTAGTLAADLRRWLSGAPTEARPAWWPRRIGMWARRNKGWAAAILLAMMFAGTVIAVQRERNIEAHRQLLIGQAQGHRLNNRGVGWSKEAWELLGQAAKIRVDDPLRNEAASSLIGFEVVNTKEFKGEGACSLAFHPSGKKIILGAQPVSRNGNEPKKPRQPIRIWDQETDHVLETKVFDIGPVAYDRNGVPLALTLQESGAALLLWDLDKERSRELALPQEIKGKVEEWVLSANGAVAAARLALADDKAAIVAWNTDADKIVRVLETKKTSVVALSPDGTLLAVGDLDGHLQYCPVKKDGKVISWNAGRLPITALAFGNNPRRSPQEAPWVVASGDQGGAIVVWDLADQSVRSLLQGSYHDIFALAFSADGVLLVSSGRSEPRIWNVVTGKVVLVLPFHDFAYSLAMAPDGTRLALANHHSPFSGLDVRVLQLENGRGLTSLNGLSGPMEFVEFSKDGNLVAAVSHLWEIGVWDAKTGRLRHVFLPRPGFIVDNAGIAFSDDNQTLAFTTSEQACLWNLQTAKQQTFALPPGMVDRLAFHAELGKFLSFRVETEDGKAWPLRAKTDYRQHPRVCRIWELTALGPKRIGEIKDFNKSIVAASMSRNARVIVVEGFVENQKGLTRTVRAYSLPDCEELWNDSSSAQWTQGGGLPLDPEGKVLFWNCVNDKGAAIRPRLVDLKTGHAEDWQLFPHCLGPQGNLALGLGNARVTQRTREVSLFRGPKDTPLVTFATNFAASFATQFSRQGTHFAWGTMDGTVILCDIAATQAKLAEARLGW